MSSGNLIPKLGAVDRVEGKMQQSKLSEAPAAIKVEPMVLPPLGESPLVSIVVANYNYARFLPDAIRSVLAQTYPHWELIICDDGSTDASQETILKLEQKDPRINSLFKENGGQASAWNRAYEHARGEIICLLDADDWFHEDKLQRVVQALAAEPKAGLVYHRSQAVDQSGDPILRPQPDSLPSGWLYPSSMSRGGFAFVSKTSDLCLRREVASRVFPLPTDLEGYGDAYLTRVSASMTEVAAIPDTLSYYQIHGANHSGLALVDQLHAPSLEKWAEGYVIAFRLHRQFLEREFGMEVAQGICLEDLRALWDVLARLYVLSGTPSTGVMGFSPKELSQNVKRSRKRYIWQLIFALPHPLSLWLLCLQVRSFGAMRMLARYTKGLVPRIGWRRLA